MIFPKREIIGNIQTSSLVTIIAPEQGNIKIFSVPLPTIIPSDVSEKLDYVNIAFIGKSKMLKIVNKCPMEPKMFESLIISLCITVIHYPCINLDKAKNDVSISKVW